MTLVYAVVFVVIVFAVVAAIRSHFDEDPSDGTPKLFFPDAPVPRSVFFAGMVSGGLAVIAVLGLTYWWLG